MHGPTRRPVAFRSQVQELFDTLHSGGLEAFLKQYESFRHQSVSFRLASGLIELGLPLSHMCRVILELEQMIGRDGMAEACRAILKKVGLQVRPEIAPEVAAVLSNGAFLSYGNHTSGVEAIVFDSLFTRSDVYQIGDANLARIGPNITKTALLVESVPIRDAYRQRRWYSGMLDAMEDFFWPTVPDPSALQRNREVLDRAADLIVARGCGVNIYPTGSMRPDAAWRNGLGSLMRRVLRHPLLKPEQVFLVPMVFGIEFVDTIVTDYYPVYCPARWVARLLTSFLAGPTYVFAPLAIPLKDLHIDSGQAPSETSAQLEGIWNDVLKKAHRKFSGPGRARISPSRSAASQTSASARSNHTP